METNCTISTTNYTILDIDINHFIYLLPSNGENIYESLNTDISDDDPTIFILIVSPFDGEHICKYATQLPNNIVKFYARYEDGKFPLSTGEIIWTGTAAKKIIILFCHLMGRFFASFWTRKSIMLFRHLMGRLFAETQIKFWTTSLR